MNSGNAHGLQLSDIQNVGTVQVVDLAVDDKIEIVAAKSPGCGGSQKIGKDGGLDHMISIR